ncbi:hypothetical protein [Endozoicomonas sp. GU-1]|uniref:hypothetical protein n=1 Tax=Endozoicomonas sp. GU-1 TaxID=3009078 RepID=UPI0022B45065|nr:hypothetical protein [Endozoicomonas sp. GU-1]WBA83136.1 hypothetical protein O2T12_08475 [Endozoicomonas sp. GU-1]
MPRQEALSGIIMDKIQIKIIGQHKVNLAMAFMDECYPPGSDTGDKMLCHAMKVKKPTSSLKASLSLPWVKMSIC